MNTAAAAAATELCEAKIDTVGTVGSDGAIDLNRTRRDSYHAASGPATASRTAGPGIAGVRQVSVAVVDRDTAAQPGVTTAGTQCSAS